MKEYVPVQLKISVKVILTLSHHRYLLYQNGASSSYRIWDSTLCCNPSFRMFSLGRIYLDWHGIQVLLGLDLFGGDTLYSVVVFCDFSHYASH
jgi:hypothetical protein